MKTTFKWPATNFVVNQSWPEEVSPLKNAHTSSELKYDPQAQAQVTWKYPDSLKPSRMFWNHVELSRQFESRLRKLRSSKNILTIMKLPRKIKIIWKTSYSSETVSKIWKKSGKMWTALSLKTAEKLEKNLEKSGKF